MFALLDFFWEPGAPTAESAAAALAYTRSLADPRGWGSKGHDPYHPLPDDYWDDRAKMIQEDPRDPSKVFEDPLPDDFNLVLDPKVVDHMVALHGLRDRLSSNLMALPSIPEMKVAVSRIQALDDELRALQPRKFREKP